MMKYFITILFSLTIYLEANSQSLDTMSISFKAKLLTTSRFGLADRAAIMEDVVSQKVVFLKSPVSKIALVKVKFDQSYFKGSERELTLLLGECFYYLAYNTSNNKFYRLGGFDSLDIEEFFGDLVTDYEKILDIEYLAGSEVDFFCLLEYSKMSAVKRARKGFNCFGSCKKEISEYLVIP